MNEPVQKTLDQISSEELALLLNQNYQGLIQSKDNIVAINTELQKRKNAQPKDG